MFTIKINSILLLFAFNAWATESYKKDYGYGKMFSFDPNLRERREAENHLNEEIKEQIRSVIRHFKAKDPVGLPDFFNGTIPDPLQIPNQQKHVSGFKMTFDNMKVYGLSQIRVEHVRTDLSALKASVGISFDELLIKGNYSIVSWLTRSKGPFNITISKVYAEARSELVIDDGGFLQAQEINFDLKFEELKMDFENLGLLGGMIQGVVNSIGTFIFDSFKPILVQLLQENVRGVLNREARNVPQQFPNSINPIDMALASARVIIREKGLDPFPLPDCVSKTWTSFELTDGFLVGLATIHRTGSILLGFERNTIHMTINVGAENLKGKYNWHWGMLRGLLSRKGTIEVRIEKVEAEVKVEQSANLGKRPVVNKIDLEFGNIAVVSTGGGTLDYVIQAVLNILPNMFRNQIVDLMEEPLRNAIQQELEKLDMEKMVEESL